MRWWEDTRSLVGGVVVVRVRVVSPVGAMLWMGILVVNWVSVAIEQYSNVEVGEYIVLLYIKVVFEKEGKGITGALYSD